MSRYIDLNRPGFSYGLNGPRTPPYLPTERRKQAPQDVLAPGTDNRASARSYALSQILSEPIQVESGSPVEALAEMFASGIRGRSIAYERRRELDQQDQVNARARALEDLQFGETKQRTGDAMQQRAARDRYLSTLPEDERSRILGGVDAPPRPDWQVDDYGRPYSLTPQGQVQYGQGRVQMRPRGSGAGQAPAGYRYTPDGNMEPIPGGPADIRQTEAGMRRGDQMDSSLNQIDNALGALDDAEGILNQTASTDWNPLNDATGTAGGIMRNVPGSRAYDFNQALEPVRAILSFETLAEMRRNSQTGGALGSIAVRELELLGNTVRSLDTAQSPQQVRRALASVRTQLQRMRSAVDAARQELRGAPAPSDEGQVERWIRDPSTGRMVRQR